MKRYKKHSRRFSSYYNEPHEQYIETPQSFGYGNPNGFRNRDYAENNFWHSNIGYENDYGDQYDYLPERYIKRRIYTDKGYEEGGYNPNLNDGYYGEESRGYRGRSSADYENDNYSRGHHYRPENYDRGVRRPNVYSDNFNEYADVDYNRNYGNRDRGFIEERYSRYGRPHYNEYESYPSYRETGRRERNENIQFRNRSENNNINPYKTDRNYTKGRNGWGSRIKSKNQSLNRHRPNIREKLY